MRVRLKRRAIEVIILRRNLTKTALARLAGLHRTHLSDLLAGRTAPGPRTRRRLLDVLGAEFDDYFEIVQDRGRNSDGERIRRLLEGRWRQPGDDPVGVRARLLRMREVLRAGMPLASEDRVWLGVEWRAAQAGRGGAIARSASGRRGP